MSAPINPCPDCGVQAGETHQTGCDVERCADCGRQRITCPCVYTAIPRLPWTGEWPGMQECREFGWYSKKIAGRGWVRCSADYPGATPDLNRLYIHANWDKHRRRWVMPCSPPETTTPLHIQPPLTCGACGALVDERQAWHRWPHRMPDASGDYIVLLQAPDTRVYQEIAQWRSEDAGWRLDEGGFIRCRGAGDPWPLAWRHVPPLPEWVQ